MKKVMALLAFVFSLSANALLAQDGAMDPAKMKERQLQQLKDSDLKLTDVQADSVVNINMETRQQMRGLRDLGDEERRTKMKEVNDYRLKRWAAALKDEALAKRVAEYYEKMRANRPNGGGGSQ